MDILEFYNKLEINLFKDPYGEALIFKSGEHTKFFDISKNFNLIEELKFKKDEDEKGLIYFLNKYKEVYFIPVETPDGEIYSFVLKSVKTKNFFNLKIKENYPFCFGLSDFKTFNFNDPIFLCEGIKDVMTLKLLYPYSLAVMTSQPSKKLWEYLESITNKLVFFLDYDEAGLRLQTIEKYGKYNKYFSLPGKKDMGDYWTENDYSERKKYIDYLKTIIDKEIINVKR